MLESGDNVPDIIYNDLGSWLLSLRVEGTYASAEEYMALKNSLQSFENLYKYFARKVGEGDENPFVYPRLAELFSQIILYPTLIGTIDRIIDKTGRVKDSASPELADVRRQISSMQGSVARAIQRIYSSAVKEGIAEKDLSPTFRDGRMVIPVPAAQKRNLNGIIHDESASGKTVFI